ncbi:MAG TPA: RDD family protein [Steroidobacteraceae bacterium]|jgi:uncharacterized RDD family membrane protein YckC|nr:RDD family protein [Steroidobacteraceae bacterium]
MSATHDDQLLITGLTGVGIELEIAGAGSRSYAFIIDWHIRVLLAIACYVAGWEIYSHIGSRGGSRFVQFTAIPGLVVYFLYHPVLEVALRGRTPGKRSAGVRIVTAQGGTPSVGALLLRNIFRLIDSMPLFYVVGLVCCLVTERRVRIGDMAAGTLLVVEKVSAARALNSLGELISHSGLPPEAAELIDDLLQRWHGLDITARDTLARTILARVDRSGSGTGPTEMNDSALRERLQALLSGMRAQ